MERIVKREEDLFQKKASMVIHRKELAVPRE